MHIEEIKHIQSIDDVSLIKTFVSYLEESIQIFINDKKVLNYTQKDIKELVNRAKEKEKDLITQRLQDLSDESREVDTEFKKHKLGDWGVGLQKGLSQYVGDFYDRELEQTEKQQILEQKAVQQGMSSNELQLMDSTYTQNDIEINDLSFLRGEDEGGDEGYNGDGDETYFS